MIALGCVAGLGAVTIHLSRAPSYLSDDPLTCLNCHVMGSVYLTWQHSSHANVATCNDCHVPHDNLLSTYAFKAQDGLRHSSVFTARTEPQVLQLSKGAVPVVQANCVRCHSGFTGEIAGTAHPSIAGRVCWDCHRETPHGVGRSLSATPDELRPRLPGVLDDPRRLTIGGRPVAPEPGAKP